MAHDGSYEAGTGTWNGPAPRGAMSVSTQVPPPMAVSEPESVRLTSGDRMPMLGLGTAQISDAGVVRTALELGYLHIDCASAYANEAQVGEGLREFIAAGRRSELFVVSKVWNDKHRAADVRASCEQSIAALGCSYLDLYLMHWPEAFAEGCTDAFGEVALRNDVPIRETWEAMEALVDAGLVRNIGVSNFSVKQVEELLGYARIPPAVNQVELHPLLAQRKLLGVLFRKGVQCVAYSPLGSPWGTELLSHPTVTAIATELKRSPAQVLLKWNLQRGVPVIPKASSREHLQDNSVGMFAWRLSNEQKAALDALDCGKRYINFAWKDWGNPEDGGVLKPSLVL